MVQLDDALAKLRDETTSAGKLVGILDKLEYQYRNIEDMDAFVRTGQDKGVNEFIRAGGISALVDVATTGWPADGNLAASTHRYDTVIEATAAAVQHEFDPTDLLKGGKGQGPKWRSPRRRAIVCLAALGHYRPYLEEMERVGFFGPKALPAMIESSFAHVDYSLHNKGYEWYVAKDQTQTVVVNLINLAGSAVTVSTTLLQQCRQQTGLNICKLYQDPFSQYVDKAHAEREELAARYRKKGWSEDKVAAKVQEHKEHQHLQENRFGSGEHFFELGGLDYCVVRFFKNLITRCSEEESLQLIHEGGLITRLKGRTSACRPNMSQDSPAEDIEMPTDLWTKKASDVSVELFKRIEQEESQALGLWQKGNEAFKAGQLQQALNAYWQAVQHNPQDYALYNNISLVALKLGDIRQAVRAAEESIRVAPAVYKSWVRLGDAFMAIKSAEGVDWWQLAHLCFSCASELAPHDGDVKARQQEARSHLAQVWTIEDVPRFGKDDPADCLSDTMMAFKWMGLSSPQDIMTMMMTSRADMDESTRILDKLEGQSRFWATSQLKGEIEDARALAVASGLIRASSLPASCAGLKRPDQLRQLPEEWQISWTDTNLRHRKTGLIRHMLTVASSTTGMIKVSLMTLGTPGLHSVRQVLLSAMLNPLDRRPGRPHDLFVAHRMFPLVHKIQEMVRPWGIQIAAETLSEAQQTSKNQDTDWRGYNHDCEYVNETESWTMLEGAPDPNNGHKPQ